MRFFIDFGLKHNFNVVLAKKQVLGTIQSYFTASQDGILLELLLKVVRILEICTDVYCEPKIQH